MNKGSAPGFIHRCKKFIFVKLLTWGKEMDLFLASSGYNTGGIDRITPSVKHSKPTRIHRPVGLVMVHISIENIIETCK